MTTNMNFLRESMPLSLSTTFVSIILSYHVQASTGAVPNAASLPCTFRFPSQSASLTQSFLLVSPWPLFTAAITTHPPPQPHPLPLLLLSTPLVALYHYHRLQGRECPYTGFLHNRILQRNTNSHLPHHNGLQCLRRGHPRAGSCAR